MPKPIIPAPAPLANLRDLGGIPVDGGKIRTGLVLRADDVATTTAEQVAELVEAGLRTIIDLRSAGEAERTGRGPSADHPVQYLALPLTDAMDAPPELAGQLLQSVRSPEQVGQWYAKIFVSQKEVLVRGLQAVADSPGAVLFHCAAGKDRTGLFAAALLVVLGAEPEAVVEDYARTQARLPEVYRRMGLTELSGGYDIPADHPVLAAHPAAMRSMLATLDSRAGGAAAVLRSGGLSSELVGRLRRKLVQPVPAQV
ncbi:MULTISPECIES: tyrosine-protein phosphatase [Arthrobacter]|uniref:tyrosine-protein phosphatase n=1 Tax=Arthrobacter TaxID=1663 RepID=UPI002106CDAC|nr:MULTISPECIES: tyrosine-protein phosphatase [Arthrobacter]MCQ1953972.1 tyrosine-protein phosphatase [Arthrobacter sp. zg-Y238]MCQ1956870.1 tyrosine-protein phosphatase [Arthrobacter jinronghuae]